MQVIYREVVTVADDNRHRALLPSRIGYRDNCCLDHIVMGEQTVFKVNRGYPFAAGLYDILGSIGQLYKTAFINMADVPGAQPAVCSKGIGRFHTVIGAGNPGAAQL